MPLADAVSAWHCASVVSQASESFSDQFSEPLSDVPLSPELAEVRNVVRQLEADMANRYGADTPAYWRAMSDQLAQRVTTHRFAPTGGRYADRAAERAHRWLVRVAAAYRALAAPGTQRPGR